MSDGEQRRRKRRHGSSGTGRPSYFRLIACGVAGTLLMGSAYYASVANAQVGAAATYGGGGGGGGGRNRDDDDGTSGLLIAGIVVGVGGLLWLAGVFDDDEDEDGEETQEGTPPGGAASPAAATGTKSRISALRLTPAAATLAAGTSARFDLQAKAAGNGKWYSVSHLPQSSFALAGESRALVPLKGAKNAFCVPITATRALDGQKARVVGTLVAEGVEPMSASADVVIRVPTD